MNLNSRLISIYTISFLSMLMRRSTAEHVLPIFTGLWYDTFIVHYEGLDACRTAIYTFNELTATPLDLLSPPTNHSSCIWDYDYVKITDTLTNMPEGFISDSEDDWNKILLNSSAVVISSYTIYCNFPDGGVYDSASVWASPFYDCPSNTRLSYDNVTFEIGCTTTPTPCVGDIVGRDLNLPSPLEPFDFFGHVGLVTTWGQANPSILEVLNGTNPGIFLNPLYGNKSFTTQSKYWGSRYEPLNFTRLSSTLASQVINAGMDQRHYLLNYTLGWTYYPGGTEEHPDNCKFRCDSFVYYCYEIGAQIKIQPYFEYPASLPITMFDYDFGCSADPVEYCSAYLSATRPLTNHNNVEVDIHKLEQMSSNVQRTIIPSLKIFQSLRPALATKPSQKNQLLHLIEKYQGHQHSNVSELFVRCLCFELKNMNPDKIDIDVKQILSDLLWKHKYLTSDNFLFSLMENVLSFYLENPHCDWLSAFFTAKSGTQTDKEVGMIAFVDQQDNVTEKANFITASRFSLLSALSDEKRRLYGKLFQKAYHDDLTLSERSRKLIFLSLSEMKTPVTETNFKTQFFQKSHAIINLNATSRLYK